MVALSLLVLAAVASDDDGWQPMREDEGVRVLRREMPGSDIVAFRGETVIEAPLPRVLWVLLDGDRRPEWVDRLAEDRTLEQRTPFDRVVYQRYAMPPLISDRDTVFTATIRSHPGGEVTVELRPTTHPKGPATVGVRTHSEGTYHLIATTEGGTWIAVDVFADPGGWIPIWLVNLIQESWPVETLNGIRRQVRKRHVKAHALPPLVLGPPR